jgi:membrane associated rhomboid family serine protease
MIVLYSFGSVLERLWGWRVFTVFYLVSAAFSSASHCFVSAVLLSEPQRAALGASGVMCGLLLAYALIFPRHRILVFGVLPVPALAGALAFIGLDIWGLFAQSQGGGLPIGHGAHLGGAVCGALMHFLYVRPRLRRVAAPVGGGPAVSVSADEAAELERLRDKVQRQGPGSLNPKEQDFLRRLQERVAGGAPDEET